MVLIPLPYSCIQFVLYPSPVVGTAPFLAAFSVVVLVATTAAAVAGVATVG